MTPTPTTHRRTGAAVLMVAAGLAVLTGCGTSTTDTPPAPTVAPAPSCTAGMDSATGADLCDPESVMTTAVSVLYSYHPATQPQKGVDIDSAATLLDPGYISRLGVSYSALAPVTGNTWEQWKAERSTVTADAAIGSDDHPADTDTTVSRVVTVTQTVHDAAGDPVSALPTMAVYTSVTRTGQGGWAVSGVSVR
ncbi:hypothetical protein BH93_27450 (plasmid) [Rhodococcoides fascians A25f]|uniref:hypothetical protein n=1 Tax=Rhodococcoides fascians TaxID=1828 RepID=UPI000566EBE2|nr:hypothetical protein [Rhodococcus fascians]QII09308.1 hypothetical protein BH93_27450 [Rhodococcus fascians A25f]